MVGASRSSPQHAINANDSEASEDEIQAADQNFKKNVRVVVRIRPLLQGEGGSYRRVTGTSGTMVANATPNLIELRPDARNKDAKHFAFDYVAQGDVVNRDFFKQSGVKRMVRKVVNGFHSTIFAYGQTGSGKSFTMEGYKY